MPRAHDTDDSPAGPDANEAAVTRELDRICESRAFRHSLRQQQLLRHLVARKLARELAALREIAIGIDFFHRDAASYDPAFDAVVRVEIARLRQRLARYYGDEGAGAAVEIALAKGSYVPLIRKRAADSVALAALQVVVVQPLPVATDLPDAEQDAAALTQEIVDTLNCVPRIRVLGSHSNVPLADPADGAQPAGAPRADWVIEGRWDDPAARVLSLALRRGNDAQPVIARHIRLGRALAPESGLRLRSEVLHGLLPTILPSAEKGGTAAHRRASPTADIAAFDLYQRARVMLRQRSTPLLPKAIGLLERAVELDPRFAAAWSELATALTRRRQIVLSPADRDPAPAIAAARRAIALDPGAGLAHATLGLHAYTAEFDWPKAERHFSAAVVACPRESAVRTAFATYLLYSARFDEALREYEVIRALDPLDPSIRCNLGGLYFYWRRFDRAEEFLAQALEIAPHDVYATLLLADTYAQSNQAERSLAAAEALLAIAQDYSNAWVYRARALLLLGRRAEAQETLQAAHARFSGTLIGGYEEAMLAVADGDADTALHHLESIALARSNGAHCIVVDPTFSVLWGDPRWPAMLARTGLPDFSERLRS